MRTIIQLSQKLSKSLADHAIYGLLGCLLVFGKHFSGTNVYGPIYLHDLILVLLCLVSFLVNRPRMRFQPLLVFFLISIMYFLISIASPRILVLGEPPISLTIALRQFAFVLYGIGYYLIYNTSKGEIQKHVTFFKWLGTSAFMLDLGYCLYVLWSRSYNFNGEFHYYYSPGALIGVFIFVAMLMTSDSGSLIKWMLTIICICLGIMSGHASAVLTIVVVVLMYYAYVIRTRSLRWVLYIGFVMILVGFVFLSPQFSDANATWRLSYWSSCLRIICIDNLGILGEGFGIPYVYDYAKLFSNVSNPNLEVLLSPSHNSFITVFYTIGLVPGLLLLMPYRFLFVLDRSFEYKRSVFVKLCLIALTIWSSFNVILELPQTAGFYWFVFFICWDALERSGRKVVVFPECSR